MDSHGECSFQIDSSTNVITGIGGGGAYSKRMKLTIRGVIHFSIICNLCFFFLNVQFKNERADINVTLQHQASNSNHM